MAKYQIEIKVTIRESDEEPTPVAKKQQDGSYVMVIDESEASSIDRCEHALLITNYPALREAISTHMSELSKKRPLKEQAEDL
jgi:hypothetical protein